MKNIFKSKIILVTGGTGSIGSEIVRQLLKKGPKTIRVLSRHEEGHHQLMHELAGEEEKMRFIIGDIRDRERLALAMEGVDYVFHAAALKHVPLCEYNPFEAVKTNIIGSQNIIDMAIKHNVNKVIAISTDKAVNPTGIMGVSKLMMEKLFTSAQFYTKKSPCFSCVRFGNVIWSDGSVLRLWNQQINEDNYIRV